MKLLVLDTSYPHCFAALLLDRQCFEIYTDEGISHSDNLVEIINVLLNKHQVKLNELDAIAVTQGPGSFTSVRLGIAVAQGLSLGANVPIISISTLAAFAQSAFDQYAKSPILVVNDARMGEVYWGAFEVHKHDIVMPMCSESLSTPQDISLNLRDIKVAIGSGFTVYPALKNLLPDTCSIYPDIKIIPASLCHLTQQAFANKNFAGPAECLPVYLRDKVAEKSLKP